MTIAVLQKKSCGWIWLLYAGLLGVYLLYWLAYVFFPEFHGRWIQGEDHIVEWITFAGFSGAALAVFSLWRYRRLMNRRAVAYFLLWGLFLFACAGEELSWGQRIFGFKTPDNLPIANEQKEFNLHNLELKHIHPKDLFSWIVKGFGIIGPLLFYRARRNPHHPFRRYLPPLCLVPCFLFPEIINLTKNPVANLVARWVDEKGAEFVTRHIGALTEEVQEMFYALTLLLALLAIRAVWKKVDRDVPARS